MVLSDAHLTGDEPISKINRILMVKKLVLLYVIGLPI